MYVTLSTYSTSKRTKDKAKRAAGLAGAAAAVGVIGKRLGIPFSGLLSGLLAIGSASSAFGAGVSARADSKQEDYKAEMEKIEYIEAKLKDGKPLTKADIKEAKKFCNKLKKLAKWSGSGRKVADTLDRVARIEEKIENYESQLEKR